MYRIWYNKILSFSLNIFCIHLYFSSSLFYCVPTINAISPRNHYSITRHQHNLAFKRISIIKSKLDWKKGVFLLVHQLGKISKPFWFEISISISFVTNDFSFIGKIFLFFHKKFKQNISWKITSKGILVIWHSMGHFGNFTNCFPSGICIIIEIY